MKSKLEQAVNSIEITKQTIKNGNEKNIKLMQKLIELQKCNLHPSWQVHLQTCYVMQLQASNSLASMFEPSLDINGKNALKRTTKAQTDVVNQFTKNNKLENEYEDLFLDYTFMIEQITNKFIVALSEGKEKQFMESIKFFKQLNSNGELI